MPLFDTFEYIEFNHQQHHGTLLEPFVSFCWENRKGCNDFMKHAKHSMQTTISDCLCKVDPILPYTVLVACVESSLKMKLFPNPDVIPW